MASIVCLVTFALSASLLSPASAEPTAPAAAEDEADGDRDEELSRPDGVSAAFLARSSKKRVEDLSRRTPSTRTFVNPDGSSTDEMFGTDQWVESASGHWVDVDYDLQKQSDGSYAPKAVNQDVTVSGGDTTEAARLTLKDGSSFAVSWPEELPEPKVSGGVATYTLSAATDLVVSVTGNGVATRIVLNEPPAEDDPVFTLGLRTDDLDVTQLSQGTLKFTDDKGKQVGQTASLMAWDADRDDSGDPVEFVEVEADLSKVSSKGDVTTHELGLRLPEGYLSDPDTTYPVTIDPDLNKVNHIRDTWVRSGTTSPQGSSYRLLIGRIEGDSNTNQAITYEHWAMPQIAGKKILKATVGFYQYDAGSCSPRRINFHPLTSGFTEASTVWTNRPSFTNTTSASTNITTNRGRTGCTPGNGWVTANVTQMVDDWTQGVRTNYGMQINANVTTDATYERRWCSSLPDSGATQTPCTTSSRVPYLNVTYNGPALRPAGFAVSPSTSTGVNTLLTSSAKPTVTAPVVDPEGQVVKMRLQVLQGPGQTIIYDGESAFVPSGGTATLQVPTAIPDGSYDVRVTAIDPFGGPRYWTDFKTLVVDTTAPPAPVVSCSGFTTDTWYDSHPGGSTTCTVTSASDVVEYDWTLNGKPMPPVPKSSSNTSLGSFTIPANGVFGVSVKAKDAAGNPSVAGEFGFGTGDAGLIAPVEGERTSTTVTVSANAPVGASWARVEYKTVDESSWTEATVLKVKGSWMPWLHVPVNVDTDTDTTGDVVWDMSAETGMKAPAVKQVRVCFVYSGVERCTPARQVALVPSAFGGSFPTQAAGPGEVALFTGELAIDETDVSVPGYGGDLSLGRSHHTFAGDASPTASVFGPGWVADLSGPDAGQAGLDVADRTATEAAISLVGSDGSSSTYVHETNTVGAQQTGVYEGMGETETDNDVLELEDRSGTKYLTLEEEDGTVTEWKHLGDGQWVISKVVEPFENSTTKFTHDGDGLVTGIYAPAPEGVTCNASTQDVGCRALWLTYDTFDSKKRLTQVDLRIYDPDPDSDGKPGSGAGMVTKTVAKYAYDSNGVLEASWDPRLGDGSSALKTAYEYDTAGGHTRLTKATPPGETPWRFAYDSSGRFETVKRAHPSAVGSGDATWTVAYDVALSGTGLPDLTETATQSWGQPAAPIGAAVVFGPDAPGISDLTYGSISYWDIEGRTTNVASYGAGAWQVDSTGYDAIGNEVWSLDEGNRNIALAADADTAAVAGTLATITEYNEAGTRVEKTIGPTRQVMIKNGDAFPARDVSTTVYDDEAADPNAALLGNDVPIPDRPAVDPDAPALNLPVEERDGVVDADGNTYDIIKTRYRYDRVVAGDGNGWVSGAPTRTSVQLGSGWSTTIARYDEDGKLVESRTPEGVAAPGGDGSGSDTRSRKIVYYTADASASVTACQGKAAWAGLECQVGPAGQPGSGEPIPVETTAGFDYLLNPTRVVETSGTTSRLSVTGYDDAGRKTSDKLSVSGAPSGDQPVPDVTYGYSATTGALTTVTVGSKTQTTTYDAWGRMLTQTDGNGNTGTTTYDTAARVASFNDGKGTYTYTYDGTDAAGKTERRGLVTAVDVGLASGDDVFKVASNADGQTYLTEYPNGMKATTTFDAAGTEVGLSYVASDDTEIVAFSNTVDADGKVRYASSSASEQSYTYDDRGRLTKVEDTDGLGCVTRQYTFSLDSNRTELKTSGPGSNGVCTTTGGTTVTSGFDDADRITTTGYDYDQLGRTRTIPKAHTDQAGQAHAGNLGIDYYANDMVAKLAQTVENDDDSAGIAKTKIFTLDPAFRLASTEDATAGTALRQTVNHYADGGDAPAWITEKTRPNASTAWDEAWTRNVLGPDGDLSIIQPSTGTAKIQITNLHGDVVTQIDNATGAPVIDAYVETTEYGLARIEGTDLGQHYGWLGGKRRSSDSLGGLVLMGVRLYNPVTGRFASMDPVYGGNDNTYTYPVDPINEFDLDGEWGVPKWAKKAAKKVGKAAKKVGKVAWKYKYDIALTVVPGGTAIRGGMAAYKGYRAIRAAKKVRKLTGKVCKLKNSFVAGTQVVMADGTTKPIEDIIVGDRVVATDPVTGETRTETVEALINGNGIKELVQIGTDPDGDGVLEWVTATDGHPFWTEDRGWTDATDLSLGAELRDLEGRNILVQSISRFERTEKVYNLSISNLHTYYVQTSDDQELLVHNAGVGDCGHSLGNFKRIPKKQAKGKAHGVKKGTTDNAPGNSRSDIQRCAKCGHEQVMRKPKRK